jgi:hypothetical protein
MRIIYLQNRIKKIKKREAMKGEGKDTRTPDTRNPYSAAPESLALNFRFAIFSETSEGPQDLKPNFRSSTDGLRNCDNRFSKTISIQT